MDLSSSTRSQSSASAISLSSLARRCLLLPELEDLPARLAEGIVASPPGRRRPWRPAAGPRPRSPAAAPAPGSSSGRSFRLTEGSARKASYMPRQTLTFSRVCFTEPRAAPSLFCMSATAWPSTSAPPP